MSDIKTIGLIICGILLIACAGGKWLYNLGFDAATAQCQADNEAAEENIEKQEEEKRAQLQKKLTDQFTLDLESRDQRMRELEAKLQAGRDQQCSGNERDRALKVAVGLEDVAKRAVRHLEAERKR